MKKILLLLPLLLVGCGSLRKGVVVTQTTHDTLYVNTLKYDSIFIDRWHSVEMQNDTVVLRELEREYRYQLLHDTMHVVRIDSVPVIHEVEVVKRERYLPWYAIVLSLLGVVMIVVFVIRLIVRLRSLVV